MVGSPRWSFCFWLGHRDSEPLPDSQAIQASDFELTNAQTKNKKTTQGVPSTKQVLPAENQKEDEHFVHPPFSIHSGGDEPSPTGEGLFSAFRKSVCFP